MWCPASVRETTLVVVLPGVPAAVDDRRAIRSGDVLCRRRVVTKERRVRRVHEQEGGCIRAPGVPSAGDRQATRRGIVLVLRSAPWSARVKRKDRNADILCRRLMCFSLFFSIQKNAPLYIQGPKAYLLYPTAWETYYSVGPLKSFAVRFWLFEFNQAATANQAAAQRRGSIKARRCWGLRL